MTEDDFVYMPEDQIHAARGPCMHLTDRWWFVVPGKGLAFYPYSKRRPELKSASPQCNGAKTIIESATREYGFGEVKFFASVLQPINPSDYTG